MNSLFTDLRKIAQHPLLMRRIFTNDRVLQMAKLAHPRCATSAHISPCSRLTMSQMVVGFPFSC